MRSLFYIGAVVFFFAWSCTSGRPEWALLATTAFMLGSAIYFALDTIADNTQKSDK